MFLPEALRRRPLMLTGIAGAAALLLAVGAGWRLAGGSLKKGVSIASTSSPMTTDQSGPEPSSRALASVSAGSRPYQNPVQAAEPPPFWERARVPEPANPRLPSPAKIPARDPAAARDFAAEMPGIEAKGAAADLNSAAIGWFGQDPVAATDWLNQTARFAELSPAVGVIAEQIASSGDGELAEQWTAEIPDLEYRHQVELEVLSMRYRFGEITREQVLERDLTEREITGVIGGEFSD